MPEEVIELPKSVKTVYETMRENGYFVFNSGGKNDFNFQWKKSDLYDYDGPGRTGYYGPDWRKRPKGKPFFAQIQLKGGKNSGRYKGAPKPEGKKKKG